MHEYGFNPTHQYGDYLELEDNMNFAIKAIDSESLIYYLIIFTEAGNSTILEYGPLSFDEDIVPEDSTIRYRRIETTDDDIDKIINDFLKPKKKLPSHKSPYDKSKSSKVTEVEQIPVQDALNEGINLFNMFKLDAHIKIEKES